MLYMLYVIYYKNVIYYTLKQLIILQEKRKSVKKFNSLHEKSNRCLTDINQFLTNICKI